MSPMPEDKPVRRCPRCGADAELWNVLPRRDRSPEVHLFRCDACHYVDWISRER